MLYIYIYIYIYICYRENQAENKFTWRVILQLKNLH